MKTKILESVESKSLREKVPHFEIGDTVDVHCKIVEGDKTRTQIFSGTVISRKGRGMNESFTVRRMVGSGARLAGPRLRETQSATSRRFGEKRGRGCAPGIVPPNSPRRIARRRCSATCSAAERTVMDSMGSR